ncbi:MAG: hypothetical protein ACRD0G_20630, partial [Acidimicrobiales bacterium]
MFIVIGLIGVALLVLSIFFDDVLDSLLPDAGWFSGPVIGAFLAAFGLFGWAIDSNADVAAWIAVLGGIGGGSVLGYFTYRLGKALWNMPTDATPTTSATVGAEGRVVTPIRGGGVGEIVVSLGGQPVKFYATADADIAT